jgi:hypothetical protein
VCWADGYDFPLHNVDEDLDSVVILLVDDQPMIGEAVRRSLIAAKEVEFHFRIDSTQAISEAQRLKPTVILQDLVMPGTDGFGAFGGVPEYRMHAQHSCDRPFDQRGSQCKKVEPLRLWLTTIW